MTEIEKEIKRRADVVGIVPNDASITRLIGAVLLEQNDKWLLQCRYGDRGVANLHRRCSLPMPPNLTRFSTISRDGTD